MIVPPVTELIVYGLYAAWFLVIVAQIVVTSWIWHLALAVQEIKRRIDQHDTQELPQVQGDYNAFERRRFVRPGHYW